MIHVVHGLPRDRPFIFGDEAGYLSQARYFGNAAPPIDMSGRPHYSYGYSLLIAPAFWLADDPEQAYRIVVMLNCLFAVLLYFGLNALVRRLSPAHSVARSAIVAFVICCHPSVLLPSNVAMSENAFLPLYVALILAFYSLVVRRWQPGAVLTAVLAVVLYLVHLRALLVPVLAVAHLAVAWWSGRLRVRWLVAALVAMAGLYAGGKLLSAHMGLVTATSPNDLEDIASPLDDSGGLLRVAAVAVGQLWYLVVATAGLFPLAAWALGSWTRQLITALVRKQRDVTPSALLGSLIATTCASVFAASVMKLASCARLDYFTYGRYNEGVLAVLLLVGWLASTNRLSETSAWSIRRLAPTWVAVAGIGMFVTFIGPMLLFPDHTAKLSAASVYFIVPFVWEFGWMVAVVVLTALAMLLGSAAAVVRTERARDIVLALVAGLVLAISFYDHRYYIRRRDFQAKTTSLVVDEIRALGASCVAIDRSTVDTEDLELAYLLPDVDLRRYYSARGEQPGCTLVVAGKVEAPARILTRTDRLVLAVRPGSALYEELDPLRQLLGGYPPDIKGSGLSSEVVWEQGLPTRKIEGRAVIRVPQTPGRARFVRFTIATEVAATFKLWVAGKPTRVKLEPGIQSRILPVHGATIASELTVGVETASRGARLVGVQLLEERFSALSSCGAVAVDVLERGRRSVYQGRELVLHVIVRNLGDVACGDTGSQSLQLETSWHQPGADTLNGHKTIPLSIVLPPRSAIRLPVAIEPDDRLSVGDYAVRLRVGGPDNPPFHVDVRVWPWWLDTSYDPTQPWFAGAREAPYKIDLP